MGRYGELVLMADWLKYFIRGAAVLIIIVFVATTITAIAAVGAGQISLQSLYSGMMFIFGVLKTFVPTAYPLIILCLSLLLADLSALVAFYVITGVRWILKIWQ